MHMCYNHTWWSLTFLWFNHCYARSPLHWSLQELEAVWNFTAYSIVSTSLDIDVDSQTRQRDLCHIDALITSLGQVRVHV